MTEKEKEKKVIGRIIKLSRSGWGFIISREIEFTRIFFHWTALKQSTVRFLNLKIGMYVEFTPIELPDRGYRATHIQVVDRPAKPEDQIEVPHDEETTMPVVQE